jgi:ketosteroid isomerase-like protein
MSTENVDFVRLRFERFIAAGEVDWDTLHEDVEVYDHDIPDRGEYRGHAGFGRWLREWGDAWAEWSLDPEEFIDAGDRVIIVAHMRAKGRGSGVEVDRQDALVYELRDGKIGRVDYYNNKVQALAAVGLSE